MPEMPGDDELALTLAAHRLHEPYPVTYRRMFAGTLTGRRIGARWFVKRVDVERLEREREIDRAQQTA